MFKLTVLIVTIALAAVVALGQAPTLEIVTPDGPNLPADLFYGNVKVKPLRLRPGTNTLITIDDSDFFVNQHYVDFLNRFPDSGGFAFWNGKFTACGGNQACIFNARRASMSRTRFSLSWNFSRPVLTFIACTARPLATHQPFPNPSQTNPTEGNKIPLYAKFKADRQLVVGGANLPQKQLDLANDFVSRPDFLSKYPASLATADQFVDAVLATIKNDLGRGS